MRRGYWGLGEGLRSPWSWGRVEFFKIFCRFFLQCNTELNDRSLCARIFVMLIRAEHAAALATRRLRLAGERGDDEVGAHAGVEPVAESVA
jgi:hypothetical protein